jgi:hypothetical protein
MPLWLAVLLGAGGLLVIVSGAGGVLTFVLLLPLGVALAVPGVLLMRSPVGRNTTVEVPAVTVR